MIDPRPYAIVFPSFPLRLGWLRFWTALLLESTTGSRFPGRRLEPYFGVDARPDEPDRLRLGEDLAAGRLAGAFFAVNPYHLVGTPILAPDGPPRVAIMRDAALGQCLQVDLPGQAWMERALDECVAAGRRRVGLISRIRHPGNPDLETMLERRGLQTSPLWIELTDQPRAALEAAQRILQAPGPRPDALVIADDNLADYALIGAERSGARIPDDLMVVAHCNFPWSDVPTTPVRRLGFDAHEVLSTSLDLIDAAARGEHPQRLTEIPVRAEPELERAG